MRAARAIRSPLFVAHVRSATGTPVQETNCHPFRRGRWLFARNGLIRRYHTLRRDLMMRIDPALFASIEGSTDSEVMFHLALALSQHVVSPSARAPSSRPAHPRDRRRRVPRAVRAARRPA
ncbi:hypothetical protein AQ610_03845 [Burkholderia humptydooensis]|uniref:Glutamine amidotransferase type-2 domain-containing protein n=1 Tax=Burkholderia humptydooensis MSMB43 TaxID=441157 RepID=A0ABN0G7Z9_9BURK|nr:hypothetical protein AQ610_03845 [Burkholderia humptydooensis]EIP88282.1 hypothetical protein A33K_14378 [Burkholderia humptydooensis MSMB43]